MNSPNLVPVKAKPIWTTKTFWFGVLVALLPFIEQVHSSLEGVIEQDWILTVIGVAIMILRLITKQPAAASTSTMTKLVERH